MKKSKIIVPALGILVLSTAAAVTGTVAWFTSSNVLSVSGLHAKVDAENGIVISNEAKSVWATSAAAQHTGEGKSFMLSSTADLNDWYHNKSVNANEAAASEAYQKLVVDKPLAGKEAANTGLGTTTYNSLDKNVYLLNRFYIQSASAAELTGQDIKVKNIQVAGNTNSKDLDKALRIAFKSSQKTVIYTAFSGATLQYTVAPTFNPEDGTFSGGTAVTAIDGSLDATGDVQTLLTNADIKPFVQAGTNAIEIEVYAYFEGEDAEAKSANITAELDDLTISFEFENATTSTNP